MSKTKFGKEIVYLLVIPLFLFIFIQFISSQGFQIGGTGGASTVTIISNGTDTNETVRFEVLIGTDCGAGDFVIGVQANGALLCATPTSVGDNSSWNQSRYYTNATGTFLTINNFNINYSANDEAYRGVTNISYYLGSNPNNYLNTTINTSYQLKSNYTDWNQTGWIINWSQVISSSGVTLAQILGFGYFNETTKNVTNNSYYLVSNPYGYLNTTINTSYYLANNPFSFYNVTTIGNLPNTNNYYNSTNPQPVINTSYYLVSNPYGYLNTTINTSYQLKSNYTDWNVSGFIRDWNASLFIKDWNATGYIRN